jgi:hypothetical protein
MPKSYIYDGGIFVNEYLAEIRSIMIKFKSFEKEEDKLNVELTKINSDQEKAESSYIRITNKSQKNSNILEELDNVINVLNDTKDKIIGYNKFQKSKKKERILQAVIVMTIFLILTSPLIIIDIIAYLEIIFLSTMIMDLSNVVKYFNDIRSRKELVKSTDIDKLGSDINKKERQKEIAECMGIALDVKKIALTNEIENLNKKKEEIIYQLEYLSNCKIELIRKLSKECEDVLIKKTDVLNQDNLQLELTKDNEIYKK